MLIAAVVCTSAKEGQTQTPRNLANLFRKVFGKSRNVLFRADVSLHVLRLQAQYGVVCNVGPPLATSVPVIGEHGSATPFEGHFDNFGNQHGQLWQKLAPRFGQCFTFCQSLIRILKMAAQYSADVSLSDMTVVEPQREVGEKANSNQDTERAHDGVDPSFVPEPPPDGGLTAWLQVLAGHLIVFNTFGSSVSFGIFQPYYQEMLGLPPSTISWVGSFQIFFIYLVGTFSGRAFDAGHYRPVLVIGSLMQLLGIFMTSIATEFWQLFLAQGVCQGIGCGLVFAPSVANTATYFERNRVMAISLSTSGTATGGIVFPLIAQQLLTRIGFGWTVRVMGLVVMSTSVVVLAVAKTRLAARKSGPLVEWAAFREPTYVLFAISMFFALWATYFAYYYVSTNCQLTPKYTDWCRLAALRWTSCRHPRRRPSISFCSSTQWAFPAV